jgi:hypothetical protein
VRQVQNMTEKCPLCSIPMVSAEPREDLEELALRIAAACISYQLGESTATRYKYLRADKQPLGKLWYWLARLSQRMLGDGLDQQFRSIPPSGDKTS